MSSPRSENQRNSVHSSVDKFREQIHIILVRPENPSNVGAAMRALANMGIRGKVTLVGVGPELIDERCRALARHSLDKLESASFSPTLTDALSHYSERPRLTLAATARSGSPSRPHPVAVRTAVERAVGKLMGSEIHDLVIVFGPESDGLSNEEVDACDWVVSVPTSSDYRSLNLAQAILVFSYEVHMALGAALEPIDFGAREGQRERLVRHALELAEAVGFVLPGDPNKMRPRLEEMLSGLPPHIPDAKTWHGLLDQAIRSVKRGEPDFKGRYRAQLEVSDG